MRFGEERGIFFNESSKIVLKNQIGDIHLAKVLKDGNLLIVYMSEDQRERGWQGEIGKFKVVGTSLIEKGTKWSKGVIWGVPIRVTIEEIKTNLKGGVLKNARRM